MAHDWSDNAQPADVDAGISSGVEISDNDIILTGNKGSDQLLRAAHKNRMKAERESLARSKNQHSAGKRQADKPHTNHLNQLSGRSIDSTWRELEIQRFAQALGAQKFQVTCTSANQKAEVIKKTYSAEQLQSPQVIKELAHLSARNHQITIQPHDSAGLIMLKNLDTQDIQKLHAAGLPPAAVVEFAGKSQAWIATGEKLSVDERRALTSRIESLVGVEKKAGMAGRMVGFAGASLSACPGHVAPAARELLGEIRAELVEAKAQASQAKIEAEAKAEQLRVEAKAVQVEAKKAQLLASAIEKTVVVSDHDFDDVGGIKNLHPGWLQKACSKALGDQSMFFASKYNPVDVERGVIASIARQGVTASQAYRAVYDGSSVCAGRDLDSAMMVTDVYTRVVLEKEGRSLEGVDVREEARKRYSDLLAYAERGTDSELKAMNEKGRQEGIAEQQKLDEQAEEKRLAVAARIESEALLNAEGETYD